MCARRQASGWRSHAPAESPSPPRSAHRDGRCPPPSCRRRSRSSACRPLGSCKRKTSETGSSPACLGARRLAIKWMRSPLRSVTIFRSATDVSTRRMNGKRRIGLPKGQNGRLRRLCLEGLADHVVRSGSAPPLPTQGVAFLSLSETHLSNTTRGADSEIKIDATSSRRMQNEESSSPAASLTIETETGRHRAGWSMESNVNGAPEAAKMNPIRRRMNRRYPMSFCRCRRSRARYPRASGS